MNIGTYENMNSFWSKIMGTSISSHLSLRVVRGGEPTSGCFPQKKNPPL